MVSCPHLVSYPIVWSDDRILCFGCFLLPLGLQELSTWDEYKAHGHGGVELQAKVLLHQNNGGGVFSS